MKRILSHVAVAAVIVCLLSFSTIAVGSHEGGSVVLVAAPDLSWVDEPGFPGVKLASIQGEPHEGPSHFFVKLPAGFVAGSHFHNADHWVAVISGIVTLTPEGGSEKELSAGSGFAFTKKQKHTTKCVEGADCVLFVDSRGKWDVVSTDKK